MPKIDDPFAGHFRHTDPRTNLFGAGGCLWPTVPAVNYNMTSDDASGDFEWLNGTTNYLRLNSPLHAYGSVGWTYQEDVAPVIVMVVEKRMIGPPETGFRWTFAIILNVAPTEVVDGALDFGIERCNTDIVFGDHEAPIGCPGSTGDTFRIEQEQWDIPPIPP